MRTKEEIMAHASNPHDATLYEILIDIRDVMLEVGCAVERALLLPYEQEETAEEQAEGTVTHEDVPQDVKPAAESTE